MAVWNDETALVAGPQAGNWRADGTQLRRLRLATTAWRVPLAVFSLALVPRLAGLGSRPFWWDEVLTQQRVNLPLMALIRNCFHGHHTPVYFLLMVPMAHMPDPQFSLRLPSAILGALNVMLVFLIAMRAGGGISGFAAAVVMGLAPTEIAFSQEARSYMLMIFCLLIALHALTGLALSGEFAARPWRTGGNARLWLQFTAGSTSAFCTLGDSLPWLLASSLTVAMLLSRTKNRRGLLQNFLVAGATSLACSLPLYLIMRLVDGNVH